jgi:hypothetical protein
MDQTLNLAELLHQLFSKGHTPETISAALSGRVSVRTVYRWKKGEHQPQNKTDLEALRELAAAS